MTKTKAFTIGAAAMFLVSVADFLSNSISIFDRFFVNPVEQVIDKQQAQRLFRDVNSGYLSPLKTIDKYVTEAGGDRIAIAVTGSDSYAKTSIPGVIEQYFTEQHGDKYQFVGARSRCRDCARLEVVLNSEVSQNEASIGQYDVRGMMSHKIYFLLRGLGDGPGGGRIILEQKITGIGVNEFEAKQNAESKLVTWIQNSKL